MLVSEAISKINFKLRGLDDDAPVFGSDEYTFWLSSLNDVKDGLYRDSKQQWDDSFSVTPPNGTGTASTAATTTLTGLGTYFTNYAVGDTITVSGETVRTIAAVASNTSLTVTVAFSNTASAKTFTVARFIRSGVQTYNLPLTFLSVVDEVTVVKNGITYHFTVIQPQEASSETYSNSVYISGANPQKLTFVSPITATSLLIGGVITMSAHYMPADMTADSSVLPFPDPNWAVMATASELAFSDIIYETKAPDLNEKANALYRTMVNNNRRGTFGNPRIMQRRSLNRITSPGGSR